ncbi:MAG: amino acid ABC transporter permease [Desulfovibrionaceae bacterium]|nr:amino acid ABC transporter permease [Desulfovibrionaceae bacterium]
MNSLAATLSVIWDALPYICSGSAVTLITVIGALALGLFLGVPMAVAQVYGARPLRWITGVYVWFFRGMPVLLLLFLFYFGLFELLHLNLSTISASCLVLGMASAAYQSQIFRGCIENLPSGQLKAARALGMNDRQAIVSIILPQALRLSIPGWSNEFSILLKDSAMCFVLGTPELMARTHFVASRTYEHLPLYMTAGIIYFCMTLIGITLLRRLERKVHIPGYAVGGEI